MTDSMGRKVRFVRVGDQLLLAVNCPVNTTVKESDWVGWDMVSPGTLYSLIKTPEGVKITAEYKEHRP